MIAPPPIVASEPHLAVTAESIARRWQAIGVSGHFLARHLASGAELGFGVDDPVPLASLAKVPIALVALDRVDRGELDAERTIRLDPATSSPGGVGTSLFQHPAQIAVGDLIGLAVTLSDNAAADALLEVVGIDAVGERLAGWGCERIRIRQPMRTMFDSAAEAGSGHLELALELAVDSAAAPGVIEALDPARANVAGARDLVELLAAVWRDRIATPRACAELRRLMGLAVFRHRIGADLQADAIRVSSKTGSFLNLRHDIGVVESDIDDPIVVAALTRTDRHAHRLPDVDLAIGAAARLAFETLRDSELA